MEGAGEEVGLGDGAEEFGEGEGGQEDGFGLRSSNKTYLASLNSRYQQTLMQARVRKA